MKKSVTIDGKQVTIVGTAHISEESRKEVRETIEQVKPDLVAVELDENRLKSLRGESGWKDLDLSEAIREGKAPLLVLNLFLSIYQRHLGLEEGTEPGQEMLEAVNAAEEKEISTALIDRDINETLSRAFSQLTWREKFKLIVSLFAGEEEFDVEELKQQDILDALIDELKQDFPSLNRVFLEERNTFMAERLKEKDFDSAVVVVGAAHMQGLVEELESDEKQEIRDTGRKIPWSKIIGYGLPAFILTGIAASFYFGLSEGLTNLKVWFASNSILAMIGAIAARSHWPTWLVSFVASPFTSLSPPLPAGLVAAYTESKLYPPKVGDLEELGEITRYRDIWGNQAGRILLTFFLVNLGSGMAAIFSGVFILLFSFLGL